jgi:hypothetical protein
MGIKPVTIDCGARHDGIYNMLLMDRCQAGHRHTHHPDWLTLAEYTTKKERGVNNCKGQGHSV